VHRRILVAALASCLLLPAAATAQAPPPAGSKAPEPPVRRPVLGIADQKPGFLADPRFRALGLRHVRLNLPWDVLDDETTLPSIDTWMARARAAGVRPLITIDRSRRRGRARVNPDAGQLAIEVVRWRQRWPGQVSLLSTWNEGNLNKRPELVARWWRGIRTVCTGCTVLGADLVDRSNAVRWTRRFIKAAGRVPKGWGLHSYNDANTFSTRRTREFLAGTKGAVWLTETGGVVNRTRPRYPFRGCGTEHAAKATEFLLSKVATLSPRIERVYLYHWDGGQPGLTWDSGLIGADGLERPAMAVVRRWLRLPPSPELVSAPFGACRTGR
jgi:hypothetical protein